MTMNLRNLTFGLLATAALILTGCSQDKLTYQNFQSLQRQVAMEHDVTATLGQPSERLNRTWLYMRPEKHLNVIIEFDHEGKLARKQWIDAPGRTWDDSND